MSGAISGEHIPARRPRGRQPKLTPEVQKLLVQLLSRGSFIEVACGYAKISVATFNEWVARGEGRDPDRPKTRLYAEFAEAVAHAQDLAHVAVQQVVHQGAINDPRLGLQWLKARYPRQYNQQNVEVASTVNVQSIEEGREFVSYILNDPRGAASLDAFLARLEPGEVESNGAGAGDQPGAVEAS